MLLLSIDGGGLRAIFSATVLMRIEEEFGVRLNQLVSLAAGSSAGAFLASGVALGYEVGPFVRKMQKNIRHVTLPRYPGLMGITSLFAPSLSGEKMMKMLENCLGESRLRDCKTGLIVTTTDVIQGEAHIFHSPYHPDYEHTQDFKIKDVVRASMAAPTYLNPVFLDNRLLADGGLSTNSPGLLTLAEAIARLNIPTQDIKMLSIGTGVYSRYNQSQDKNRNWGLLRWGKSLVLVTLQAHSDLNDTIVRRLLGDRYLKLQMDLEEYYDISDPNNIPHFVQCGKRVFEKNRDRIYKLIFSNKKTTKHHR